MRTARNILTVVMMIAAIGLLAGAASAAVVNVDFGLTPYAGASANGPLASGSTWNQLSIPTGGLSSGTSKDNLFDDSGTATTVDVTFGGGWAGFYNDTGPNNLQRDRAYTSGGGTGAFTVSGLTPGGTYNLALTTAPDGGGLFATDFTVGATTLNATGGSAGANANGPLTYTAGQTHALFNGVTAGGGGDITFSTTNAGGSTFGVLAGLQIDGSFPSPPPVVLYDDFSTNPNIAAEWTQYGYYAADLVTPTWNSTDADLDLVKTAGQGSVGLYRTGSSRLATDPVTLTVKDLSRTSGTWGFAGLMVSAVPQPGYITTGDDTYTLRMQPTSATEFNFQVTRTYQDGTSNYVLYDGAPQPFSGPYDLDIERVGDDYVFKANGATLYTTGTAAGDTYSTASKNSMVYYETVLAGDGAMTATVDDFGIPGGPPPPPPPPPPTSFSITTADGNGADASVLGETSAGNTNYGSDPLLNAQDFTAASSWLAFARFDVSGVSPGSFTSATLELTSADGGHGAAGTTFEIHGLKDSENADGWGEGTITYNNAPGLTFVGIGSADVDPLKTDFLGTAVQTANGVTLNFSNANLLAFLNADTDGLVTFIFSDDGAGAPGALQWASKEHTLTAPTLTFQVASPSGDIPEPATMVLLSLAACGLGGYVRRRRKA